MLFGTFGATTSAADARVKFGDRSLGPGARGHDVRVLQSWLTHLGHRTDVDGHFGSATRRSVRRYERAEDIRVDGRVSRGQARGMRSRVERRNRGRRSNVDSRPVGRATLASDGRTAIAPAGAPRAVVEAIEAANRITRKPYLYGGGHGRFEDRGYDCSGAVSYALRGAGRLDSPLASGGLMSWGERGRGKWITVYANAGHAYVVVAGLRFDTSGRGEDGPRWRPEPRSSGGYAVRHPRGL
jgi:peptidoglycan hydrolase-like protein with peptidoglycan-binding domain